MNDDLKAGLDSRAYDFAEIDALVKAAGEILEMLKDKALSAEESMTVLIAALASSVVSRVSGNPDKARIAGAAVATEFAGAVEKMLAIHGRSGTSKN